MKILLTGGAGFIGSHVADQYLEAGYQVVIIDDLSSGSKKNIPQGTVFYQEDITSPRIHEIISHEKPDVLNHHAAQIDVRQSVQNPLQDLQINVGGTLNLLEACRHASIQKVIFASSGGAILGEQSDFPADESHPTNPCSPYGINKLMVEKYLQYYVWTFQIPFVVLRYANVYGPRQNSEGEAGVVSIFCDKLLQGEKPVVYGDGTQTRDYIFVEDVVHCNLEALKVGITGVFNVGTGIETDVNQLARALMELSPPKTTCRYAPARIGEQKRSCLKPGMLQKEPPTPLIHGLTKTLAWFEHQRASKRLVDRHAASH